MKGKLRSVVPLMRNDAHNTWTSSRGDLMYDFSLEVEVDDKVLTGSASAKRDVFRFKAGDQIVFEYKENDNPAYPAKFSKVADPNYQASGGGTGGARKGEDFYVKMKVGMCKSTGSKLAVNAAINLKKEVSLDNLYALTKLFQGWLLTNPTNQEDMSKRMSALSRAVECIVFDNLNIADSKAILTCADLWLANVSFE
jgi:hypothetical protein